LRSFGQHLLAEYRGCDRELLNDIERVETHLRRAADLSGATIVAAVFHRFSPQGVTGVVVVEESHLSVHTWPEHGYAAVDFYTCGECHPERAYGYLREALGAEYSELMEVERGIEAPDRSITVRAHTVDETGDDPRQIPLPGLAATAAKH
jgi:S-adenosylmethionine decarboxylase proenzyme